MAKRKNLKERFFFIDAYLSIMISLIRENVATHDPEVYEKIKLTPLGVPYCPVCDSLLQPSSPRESNNMWKCENYDKRGTQLKCDFIEAKFSKKKKLLWDCRYEPSFIIENEFEED